MQKIRVNLSADFHDPGGWGRHGRGFASGLAPFVELATCGSNPPSGPHGGSGGEVEMDWRRDPLPDAVGVALGPPTCLPKAIGSPRVLFSVWETSRVPEQFLPQLNAADTVWVPTKWGRQIFVRSGLAEDRVRVVPEGVDSVLFRPGAVEREAGRSPFRFLCVGKWENRKGTAMLVRAFVREFKPSEAVELVMLCHNPYLGGFNQAAAIAGVLAVLGGDPAPRIVARDPMPLPDLIRVMQSSDAFVLPTRGEAWGLPILEAMACGLPCIVTDWSGLRAFANESNSYLISVARHCAVHDPIHFEEGLDWGEWAEPDEKHLQHLMRHVYENREEAKGKGRLARQDAVGLWSWNNAGGKANEHLRDLISPPARL